MAQWLSDSPGARLRRRRKERGLTQAQLGALFDVSRTAVFEWEAGRIGVPNRVLAWLESGSFDGLGQNL